MTKLNKQMYVYISFTTKCYIINHALKFLFSANHKYIIIHFVFFDDLLIVIILIINHIIIIIVPIQNIIFFLNFYENSYTL